MKLCCFSTSDHDVTYEKDCVPSPWAYPAIAPEYITISTVRLEDYYESISHCSCCQTDNKSIYDNFTPIVNDTVELISKDIATQTCSSEFLLASSESSSPLLHDHSPTFNRPPRQVLDAQMKAALPGRQCHPQESRQFGYSSQTPFNLSLLERLVRTYPIWYMPRMDRDTAKNRLKPFPPGVFLLRQSNSHESTMALSVRVRFGPYIEHYLIHSSSQGLRVNGSQHHFEHIPGLIEHYCNTLGELPVRLQLPSILMESTVQELGTLSRLGPAFWTSPLVHRSRLHRTEFRTTIPSYNQQQGHDQSGKQHSHSSPDSVSCSCNTHEFSQACPVRRNLSAPEVDEITNLEQTVRTDSKRLSLTQINHSHHSPFQQISPVEEDGEEVFIKSGLIAGELPVSSHDYVNLPNSPDSIIHEVKAFQPIETSQDNDMQNIMQELDDEIHKLMLSVAGEDVTLPTAEELPEMIKQLFKKEETVQIDHVEEFAKSPEKRPTIKPQPNSDEQHNVFKFDFDSSTQIQRNETRILHSHGTSLQKSPGKISSSSLLNNSESLASTTFATKNHSPLSPKSQYSSPAYCEPFDSLIGKVAGVSATTPALKVDDAFLRQKMAEKLNRQKENFQQRRHNTFNAKHLCSTDQSASATSQSSILHNTNVHHAQITSQNFSVLGNSTTQIGTKDIHRQEAKGGSTKNVALKPERIISIHQPLDSNMASSSKYRISLEEIPLNLPSQMSPSTQSAYQRSLSERKKAERSWSLKMFDNPVQGDVTRARSLPRDARHPPVYTKPPSGSKDSFRQSDFRSKPQSQTLSKAESKRISNQLEDCMFSGDLLNSPGRNCKPFPLHDTGSDCTSLSESSTAEDFLYDISPELTFNPSGALTRNNLLRISAYDNCHAQHCGSAADSCMHNGASSPQNRADGSVITQYCEPWDSSREHWTLLLHPSTVLPSINSLNETFSKDSLQHQPQEQTSGTHYDNSLDRSLSGMGIGCSTLEWRKCENVDSATETTPQPGLAELEVDDEVETVSVIVERAEAPVSDDEGVEMQHQAPVTTDTSAYPATLRMCSRSASNVQEHVTSLANSKDSMFGVQVANFVQCTKEGTESNPHIVLRNIRQFMTGIKNYLVQSGEKELNRILEQERGQLSQDEFLNVDAVIEGALHKCVVKPLKRHIHKLFVEEYKNNGSLQQMHDSIQYARSKSPQQLGIKASLQPPHGTNLEVIKYFLQRMKRAYSPLKKLEHLLGATSCLINGVQAGDGLSGCSQDTAVSLGADDFLPMLIYVLVQAGVTTIEIEADYMWGLLHPCLLAGEGGYYLTTLSSAVHLLKNLKSLMQAGPDKVKIPCLGDMQGFIKIIIPDEKQDSIITKTLPVRPNMTTKDVCNMIAHKFKITNPQDYGLYIISSGTEEKLSDNRCPQDVKQTFAYTQQECIFAYKRNNAKFVWPVNIRK